MSGHVQISRDPFARTDLVRRTVDHCSKTCSWCGSFPSGKRHRLYAYGTERDGVRASYRGPHWHDGLFCSKSCHDSYHER